MANLLFFGHDAYDPALQRRIAALARAGAQVRGFTMRRGAPLAPPWDNVDLGETRDAAFAQRLGALLGAAPALRRERAALQSADLIWARNLDMLALARWAKAMSGSRAALIYECLDIHRFMTRADALGAAMRASERCLLGAAKLVIVSSPAFARDYFDVRHPGRARTVLVENRMPAGFAYGPRPAATAPRDGVLRIGWFGNLRCRRSLALLLDLARRFPERVELCFRGAPARAEIADFEADVAGRANVRFGGRYRWPDDLAAIYGGVDMVWAGDFFDPGANSKWLLPNRLYEGGYYGAAPIAPANCETGRWVERHGVGFTLAEPLEHTLPAFIETLDSARVGAARARLLAQPAEVFVQPESELRTVLDEALEPAREAASP